jgi:hypothetical protein
MFMVSSTEGLATTIGWKSRSSASGLLHVLSVLEYGDRPCRCRVSFANYQHGAVGVANHRIRNAAHQGPPYPPAPPATHHYQPGP